MADEVKLLLLRHKLKCLKEKQKQIEAEIEDTKKQITLNKTNF